MRLIRILFWCLWLASASYGNVSEIYGTNGKGIALGNAMTAGGDGAFAAQSNPAALFEQKGSQVALGFNFNQLSLNDLSSLSQEDRSGLPASPYRADKVDGITGNSVGLNLELSPVLRFGLSAYMPSGNFGKLVGVAPNDVHYLRGGDNQERPAIYTALAAKYGKISLGLGSYYTLRAEGTLQMALNNEASAARFALNMSPVMTPYGGILYRHNLESSTLSIGALYRGAQSTKSNIDTLLAVGAVGDNTSATLPVQIQTSLVPFYDPEIIRMGFKLSKGHFKTYFTSELSRWSQYKAPLIELKGADIASLTGLNERGSVTLQDTHAHKLGLAYLANSESNLEFRLGFEYHQSATEGKAMGGIVDPERNVIAMGIGADIFKGMLLPGKSASLDVSYQKSILRDIEVNYGDSFANAGGYVDTLVAGLTYEL